MNRFWEFYVVRYFVGTVVGSVIVALLLYHPESIIAQTTSLKIDSITKLQPHHFLVAATLGLAFCYISSSPILVLHTTRCYLSYLDKLKVIGNRWVLNALILIFSMILGYFYIESDAYNKHIHVSVTLVIFVIVYQALLVSFALRDKLNELFDFYKSLVNVRAGVDNDKVIAEYTESYKHLREHGNAFLILLFESILGAALFFSNNINFVVSIIVIWLTPSLFVWFFATYLESKMGSLSQDQPDGQ